MNILGKPPRHSLFVPTLVVGICCLLIIAGGVGFYQLREKALENEVHQNLTAIADLKLGQLLRWQEERLRDGRDLQGDPVFSDFLERWRANPQDSVLTRSLRNKFAALCGVNGYYAAGLLNGNGKVLLGFGDFNWSLCDGYGGLLNQARSSRTPVMSGIHRSREGGKIHLSVITPIGRGSAIETDPTREAFLLYVINPDVRLYPMIQHWPTPSPSGETLLLERDGAQVVYLNELRHRSNTALTFKMPTNNTDFVGGMAVRGVTGVVSGVDYRGIPVLAAVHKVPGSSWILVAKLDRKEGVAPLRRLFFAVFLTVIALVAFASLGLFLWERNMRARQYRDLWNLEKERAELADGLRQSEARFRALFDSMTEGVALYELVKGPDGEFKDCRFLQVNPAFTRLTGFKELAVRGRLASEIYASSAPLYQEIGNNIIRTGATTTFEIPAPATNKILRVSAFYAQNNVFASVFEDITEQKNTQLILSGERDRLLVTLRSIGDAVITTDIEGRVTLMNQVAEVLTGWTLDQAVGHSLPEVFEIFNEETGERCEDPVERVLRTGRIVGLANHTKLRARQGLEYVIADSGAPIKDLNQKTIGVVLVFRDITSQSKIDMALVNAQKLESLGLLAGGIAHDFNNLLSGLFCFIDLALMYSNKDDHEKLRKSLKSALEVFERAKGLGRQLLTFAKGGAPIRHLQPVGSLLQKTVTFALSGSCVVPVFSLPSDLWECEFDENLISQVFDNITINARQAMSEGGTFDVTAKNVNLESDSRGIPLGNYILITMRDHGPGIPIKDLPRVFDPFFTTKTKGSGLGLSTSYSIVQRHEGLLSVESSLGEGATFNIWLPARPGMKQQMVSEEASKPQRGSGRVLIMDDEEYMRIALGHSLELLGYVVKTAATGEEAQECVRHALLNKVPFQFAILDLTIPGGMGGKEAAPVLHALDSELQLIVSSGYSDHPVMSNPRAYGFVASIGKPYKQQDLALLLEGLGSRRES
jgi:PAS domain S-box-containing protein